MAEAAGFFAFVFVAEFFFALDVVDLGVFAFAELGVSSPPAAGTARCFAAELDGRGDLRRLALRATEGDASSSSSAETLPLVVYLQHSTQQRADTTQKGRERERER